MWERIINRLLDMFTDIIETRTVLALVTVVGFFMALFAVINRLDNPPAAELFAILNLALVPASSALSFWFGFEKGRQQSEEPKEPTP